MLTNRNKAKQEMYMNPALLVMSIKLYRLLKLKTITGSRFFSLIILMIL